MRKRYSAEFKAKVALEALRERETLAVLSSRHGVHRMLIQSWKKQALKGLPSSFARGGKPPPDDKEKLIDSLYREIGKLQGRKGLVEKKI